MDIVPRLQPSGNSDAAEPTSNARTPGDIRRPILLALDAQTAAWKRRHAAQVEAACGNSDPVELAAALADVEAAEASYLRGSGDMSELALALLRCLEADPSRGGTACDLVARLAGTKDLEQLALYFARRLDAVEKRLGDALGRIAELEDDAARTRWDHSDHDSAVTA